MAIVKQKVELINDVKLENSLGDLKSFIKKSAQDGNSAHDVESGIWKLVLNMGRQALGSFFDFCGTGDLGEEIETATGKLQLIGKNVERVYTTVFGEMKIRRATYGTRAKQKIEFVPLDTRLRLPDGRFSYLLQDWDQSFAIENSFNHSREIIKKILNVNQSVDSLERMNQKMSLDVKKFREEKKMPDDRDEGKLLVVSADGKGVPMKKETLEKKIESHQKKGIKKNKKQMAIIGAAYTIDPLVRTPEDVISSLFSTKKVVGKDGDRPRSKNKHIYGSLSYEENGLTVNAEEKIFGQLQEEVLLRTSNTPRKALVLMDGQRSLWAQSKRFFPKGSIEILDLLHVTPRIWQTAHLFNKEGSEEALEFVKKNLLKVLQGKTGNVIKAFRRMGTERNFKKNKKKSLNQICNYLSKNKRRLKYNEYLKNGYPIATGVIEGACRYFVKDRMEGAGMRWTIDGAQAMLDVRSISINEDWDEFTKFRIKREETRLYPHKKFLKEIAWPLVA